MPFDSEIIGLVTPDTSGLGHLIGYCSHYPHQYTLPASSRSDMDNIEPSIPNSNHLTHELGVVPLNDIIHYAVYDEAYPEKSLQNMQELCEKIR